MYRTRHDWDGPTPLTETIHDAISTVDPNHDPTSGVSLFSVIETARIDELFGSIDPEYPRDEGFVSFPFQGYWITVIADGRVTLRNVPPDLEELREGQ